MFYDIGCRIWLTTEVNEGFPIGLLQVRIPDKILAGWKITDTLHSVWSLQFILKMSFYLIIWCFCLPVHLSICSSVSAHAILHALPLICPFVYLAIYLSVYVYSHPATCLHISPLLVCSFICLHLLPVHMCLYITPSVYKSICSSVCPFCLSIFHQPLYVHLSACPSFLLSACSSICIFVLPCVKPTIHLPTLLHIHLLACLMSVRLFSTK